MNKQGVPPAEQGREGVPEAIEAVLLTREAAERLEAFFVSIHPTNASVESHTCLRELREALGRKDAE